MAPLPRPPALVALAAALLAGCANGGPIAPFDAGPQEDSGPVAGLQLNDVSILFPLAADGGSVPDLLSASSSGARGALLPQALYDDLGHITGSSFIGPITPGGQGEAEYADLRVVAVRLDPCFAALAPDLSGAGCLNQLRLILQEVTVQDGAASAFDSALHLFYSLSRDELKSFARGVLALRRASAGDAQQGPLAPNPIIAAEGEDGPFATGLRALVLQFAGAQNLTRVTRFSSRPVDIWAFDGFDISSPGNGAHLTIPSLPASATTQSFFLASISAGGGADLNGGFDPETSGPDDLAPLAGSGTAQLTAAARASAFDALLRLENPTRTSANTDDCAGCHLATPTALSVALPVYGLSAAGNGNAFAPDLRFVRAADLTPTFTPGQRFNLHAFSYVGTEDAINQRVINESAAIVAYLGSLP